MFYELQKTLATKSYKAPDLHEFVKMCRYTDQILRDVNNKSRREKFFSDAARDDEVTVFVNSNQTQNSNRSIFRSRFEISESSSRAITQSSSSENQVNFINCYNREKSKHFFRNCRQSRRMNSNNFVRKMNVHDKNDSFTENLEIESRKE
jgi:hypothetical protein